MTTELANPTRKPAEKPSALGLMASRLNVETDKLLGTLKATVFKGANNEELLALVVVANEYGLNPLLKEIYAFPAKGGGIQPVVGIDGWLKMINRHIKFDGLESPVQFSNDGKPESCTCAIWVKGRKHPVRITEYYDECFRQTDPWKTMPARMLRHKAISQCARVAFGFSGIQDEDEARDTIRNASIEKIPAFDVQSENKQLATPNKVPSGALETLRMRLLERNIAEKTFCQGLQLIGYEIADVYELSELTQTLIKQLASMDMDELLDLMEQKAQAQK